MEWTRLPTWLLTNKTPERELVAIVKYQLLWADFEQEPSHETALRWLTEKQLAIAMNYRDSISKIVGADIKTLIAKRGRDRKRYYKSKENTDITPDGTSCETTSAHSSGASTHITADEINNKNETKSNDENNTEFKGIPIPVMY